MEPLPKEEREQLRERRKTFAASRARVEKLEATIAAFKEALALLARRRLRSWLFAFASGVYVIALTTWSMSGGALENAGKVLGLLGAALGPVALLGAAALTVGAGVVAFLSRQRWAFHYGCCEVAAGASAVVIAIRTGGSPLAVGVAFLGGVYVVVRGLDNATKKIREVETERVNLVGQVRDASRQLKDLRTEIEEEDAPLRQLETRDRAHEAVEAAKQRLSGPR